MAAVRTDCLRAAADLEWNVVARQVRVELALIGMSHMRLPKRRPQRPGRLADRPLVPFAADGDDIRRVREMVLERLQVLADQLVFDDVAVDLGEGRIAVGDPAQRNDKLEEIRVRLLPEGLLRLAEQVIEQAADRIGDGVRVEVVVQRVVADAGMQPDFEVVRFATGGLQHPLYLPAEVPLHFEDESTDFPLRIARSPPQELIDVRIHARGGLAGADGAENHDARVEAALRNRQPRGDGCRAGRAPEVRFAEDEGRRWAGRRIWIGRQRPWTDAVGRARGYDRK